MDYLDYLEQSRALEGEDVLEPVYEAFIAAIDRASAAECQALFSTLDRLEYYADGRPPYPAEQHLPIAERLWAIILAKPGVSLNLLARGGLFHWVCRREIPSSSRALAALGHVCEDNHFEFWRVPPFLPFWAAAQTAASDQDWDFAALCLKRALIDIVIFAPQLGPGREAQVHEFAFDPRFIKDLFLELRRTGTPGEDMLRLAFELALQALRATDVHEWSQISLVLQEVTRRLGGATCDETPLRIAIGEDLWIRLSEETQRMLHGAEASWSSVRQRLDTKADCGTIGLAYRVAIETEWRLRLAPLLNSFDHTISPSRAMLGEMLRALKEHRGVMGDQLLRQRLAEAGLSATRLLNQAFLERASQVVKEHLNDAAHRPVDRKRCKELRNKLFEDRLLRDLLMNVQPSSTVSSPKDL